MTADPYTPPAEAESPTRERRSVLAFAGFVVAVMLVAILLLLTVASAYQNYAQHASFEHDWQRLPVYVLLLPFHSLACAGTMTLSALSFRQNRNRRAIAWFVGTVVAFFGVPPVLLLLLYGIGP